MINYAIIGFGGLGKLHFQNLTKIENERKDIKLTAICNDDLDAIKNTSTTNISSVSMENVNFSKYNLYSDYKEMIALEKLDFVVIALPSFLHCDICLYCFEHGIDVYVEKPMAITLDQCKMMKEAAEKNGRKLMVGQCLRFTDEYIYIKKLINSGEYGKVIKAEFSRKSPLPAWSAGSWLLDESKSGGIIVDFHVHDVDIVNWFFGKPDSISVISTHKQREYASIYTQYKCNDVNVSVITDWGLPATFKFKASYAITFENAYIENINGDVTVFTKDEILKPEYEKGDCYIREINEFLELIANEKNCYTAEINSVYESMEMLFEEKNLV